MFVCRGCIKDKSLFDQTIFKSKGPCENCRYIDICVDIRGVQIDSNWRKNLEHDLSIYNAAIAEQERNKP